MLLTFPYLSFDTGLRYASQVRSKLSQPYHTSFWIMSASVSVSSKDSLTVVSIQWWAVIVRVKATIDTRVNLFRRAVTDKPDNLGTEYERLMFSHLDTFSQGWTNVDTDTFTFLMYQVIAMIM